MNEALRLDEDLGFYASCDNLENLLCTVLRCLLGHLLMDLKAYFRDPSARRAVSSALRGIAKYGITRHQVLRASFLIVWNFTNMCNLSIRTIIRRQASSTIQPDDDVAPAFSS